MRVTVHCTRYYKYILVQYSYSLCALQVQSIELLFLRGLPHLLRRVLSPEWQSRTGTPAAETGDSSSSPHSRDASALADQQVSLPPATRAQHSLLNVIDVPSIMDPASKFATFSRCFTRLIAEIQLVRISK